MYGSQRQIYYVVTNLNRDRYEPIVVCSGDGQLVSELENAGIATRVLPLHPWRKFPACLCRYLDAERLASFARQHRVALVHSSDLWLNGYLIWTAERLKLPSVLHVRKPIQPEEVGKHRCSRATSIIAISHRIRQNLLGAGIGPEKITVIDDGVDLEVFRPSNSQANVLRRDFSAVGEVLVGIVGRIEPLKRQLTLLRAAEEIVRISTRSVTFFVIGEVHSRSYFKKVRQFVSEKGLDRHVLFTGRRNDMPQALCSLDILVSLSGGSVMFEAMACGKPVISAGFSNKEDSVHIQDGHTGFLVTSTLNSELTRVLVRLIERPDVRRQIGKNARNWAEKKLSHIDTVDRTERLYEQLLEG